MIKSIMPNLLFNSVFQSDYFPIKDMRRMEWVLLTKLKLVNWNAKDPSVPGACTHNKTRRYVGRIHRGRERTS